MGDVEAVLFDLDDTVCEYRRSSSEVLAHAFAAADVEPFFSVEDYRAVRDDFVAESEDVEENRERSFAALAEAAGRDPDVGRRVAAAYAAERDHGNVAWVPGAEAALERFGESYRVAAITNGAPGMQAEKLDALGIADQFETVVYAGFDTAPKPDPAAFEVALDALGVAPERAIKVGDSLELDVRGAHNAGVSSVWLEQDGVEDPEPEPHYRVETMRDLLDEPWD